MRALIAHFPTKKKNIHTVGGAGDWDGQLTVEEVKCPTGEPDGYSNAPTIGGWESGDYVGGWE